MSLVPSCNINANILFLCVLLTILLLNPTSCCGYGRIRTGTRQAVYVFGDSLFDAGNNQYYTPTTYVPANHHPYGMSFVSATGRHSDGLLVPDLLVQYAKMTLIPPALAPNTTDGGFGYNFASAGSGCLNDHDGAMNLAEQMVVFKNKTQKLKESLGASEANNVLQNAVYLFSMGGNDYLSFVTNHKNASQTVQKAFVDVVVTKLTTAVKEIYEEGSRKFVFQDVGPIGCLPTLKYYSGMIDGCYEYAENLVKSHNTALREALQTMKASQEYSHIKYGVFDYYNQLRNRIKSPTEYGFTISEIACCGLGGYINGIDCGMSVYLLCSNPSSFVMFDGAHTTQQTNSQLAKLMWFGDKSLIAPYNVKQLFEDDQQAH